MSRRPFGNNHICECQKQLLSVKMNDPTINNYNLERDIASWLTSGGGSKHVKGHYTNPALSLPRKNT